MAFVALVLLQAVRLALTGSVQLMEGSTAAHAVSFTLAGSVQLRLKGASSTLSNLTFGEMSSPGCAMFDPGMPSTPEIALGIVPAHSGTTLHSAGEGDAHDSHSAKRSPGMPAFSNRHHATGPSFATSFPYGSRQRPCEERVPGMSASSTKTAMSCALDEHASESEISLCR